MSDLDPWIAFQNGDQSALEKIYRGHYAQLYNYGFKWLRDSQLVEDSIHDLFVKLIRNRERLAVPQSVRNYLFFSFRSIVLDKFKARKPQLDIDEYKGDEFMLQVNAEAQIVEEQERAIIKKRIEQSLEKLTPRQREAIFLKYYEGFTYEEIAEVMSLTKKATYKLIGRAIESLRAVSVSMVWLFWTMIS